MSKRAGGYSWFQTMLEGLLCVRKDLSVFPVSNWVGASFICEIGLEDHHCVRQGWRVFSLSDRARLFFTVRYRAGGPYLFQTHLEGPHGVRQGWRVLLCQIGLRVFTMSD